MTKDVIVVETTSSTLKCKISSTLREEFRDAHDTDLRLNMAVQVQVVCKSSTQSSTEELAMQTTRYDSSDDEEGENDGLEMSQALSIARATLPFLLIRGGSISMYNIAKGLANAKDVQILWEYSGDTHFADVIHCLPAKDLISLSATASELRGREFSSSEMGLCSSGACAIRTNIGSSVQFIGAYESDSEDEDDDEVVDGNQCRDKFSLFGCPLGCTSARHYPDGPEPHPRMAVEKK